MKTICLLFFYTILLLACSRVFAQEGYTVSGVVTNEKGEPQKSATVFIGGSERVMPTDENGRFNFNNIPSGTFQLSVQLLGYASITRNVIIKSAPVNVNIQLQPKTITLAQVTIGKDNSFEKNLKLFKEMFLGKSVNSKQCAILNPQIINFSTKKGFLLADADDFLIIENKALGYRVRYLLTGFSYNYADNITLYHGECSFQELEGTDKQKRQWAKNRLAAYQGSFMHFLRSVYANNTLENGFITRPTFGFITFKFDEKLVQLPDRIIIRNRLLNFDSLVTAIDTNFTSFKFRQDMYVNYDPKHAANFTDHNFGERATIDTDPTGSVLELKTDQAIIDKKGSYTDYRDFFIQGYWAKARVGDELPVEYKAPTAEIPHRVIPSNPLFASLQKWTDSIPQEKAYLHMDKPYYAVGDTIWFKGYLTTGSRHRLSPLSGAVYVDLIDDQDQAVKTLKLPADSGTVAGDLILDEDIKAGSYRVRVYTQWMRNAGEDYFFNRTITIGNPLQSEKDRKILKPTRQQQLRQPDVQFFPEGGELVNNITSRVGFKAVGSNGLGVDIGGTITDNENTEIARLNTLHAGMGIFLLKPLPGKTYTAHIKFADSTTKSIPLPMALNEGYVLNVYQPGADSILVRVQASATLQHSTVNLIAHSSGEVIYTSQVQINSAVTSIWLDKRSFPGGIAQFTLFDTQNQPLNERIAFIRNNDNMQLGIKADKVTYKSKEHVQLELAAKGSDGIPDAADFSIAVIDESKVPVDENSESTIFSNILLSADLKGYIEKPNYYFTADSDKVNRALDNLMLTQGYRRFEWKLLDSVIKAKPIFKAEGVKSTIAGTVTDLRNRPLPNAAVLLVSLNARINRTTLADANGRFKFDNLLFADSAKFAVQARDLKNTDHAIITLDSIPKIKIATHQNLADINIIKANLQKAEDGGGPAKLTDHILKQVNIKGKKINVDNSSEEVAPQSSLKLPDEQSADQIITILNPEDYPSMLHFLQGRLPGIHIEIGRDGYHHLIGVRPSDNLFHTTSKTDPLEGKNISVGIDGESLDAAALDRALMGGLRPEDVAKILVVRTNQAMVSYLGGHNNAGFVLILTKPKYKRKQYNPGIANISPKGYNKVRQFYSPRYERPDGENKQPDLRSTIYWNPYVNTDATGRATVDFYNANGPGKYTVVVEGINAAGELGRQVYKYTVE